MMTPSALAPADAWNLAADGWNRHGPTVRRWLADATRAMLDAAALRPGARVLDIAAGAGDPSIDVARRVGPGGHVLATDISPRFAALAEANARAAGLPQIECRVADAQQLGLDGADFDAAVCRLGLMFCRDPLAALHGILAALRPGGRFAALVFDAPALNPCIGLMLQTAWRWRGIDPPAWPPAGSLLSLGSPGRMQALLSAAGFADVELHALSAPFELPSAAHYVEFVRDGGSPIVELLAPLSASDRDAAWAEMTRALQRFDTGSGWEGPNGLLLCSAARPA